MSFRKRNTPVIGARAPQSTGQNPAAIPAFTSPTRLPGTRPSPVDGRLVTSTGAATLDNLLAGHGGLALGTSLLIEENGATDYAGALLRFYAAEGLLQGHHVHVVGLPESWGRELPGQSTEKKGASREAMQETDRMKIAWRYQKLGQQDTEARDRTSETPVTATNKMEHQTIPFNHGFDLSKRLAHPPDSKLSFLNLNPNPRSDPFAPILSSITTVLASSSPTTIHRVIFPSFLSPAIYPPHSTTPAYLLAAMQTLRSLLTTHINRLSIIIVLPNSLYPRSSGLTRWLEILSDGVLELLPFPHSSDAEFTTARDPNTKEEPPQGLLKVHKLPVLSETGSGTPPSDTDWTFTLSRRKFTIKPFNLPPIEGDTDAQQSASSDADGANKPKKAEIEF